MTEREFALPVFKPFVVKTGKDWFYVPRFPKNRRISGSALDVSAYLPKGEAGSEGFLIEKNGHFVFEKNPGKPVRFLINPIETLFTSKEDIDICVAELRKNGYNMVRTHFLDAELLSAASKPLEFRRDYLERLDYFIYCMKKNGIYLNFDCMTSWIGYMPGAIWKNKDPEKSFKSRIYFDPAVRKNWRDGVEKLLTRVNPYTKTRLVDDPVLVMAVAFNEQEFGLWNKVDPALILPKWQGFLKDKYGKIENLNAAWKPAVPFKSFEEIRTWKENSADFWIFRLPMERELAGWFKKQLREYGQRLRIDGDSMDEMLEAVNIYDASMHTGNDALDVILSDKALHCEKHGIQFGAIVDGAACSFLPPMDLYALFGNILDNAIEAVNQLDRREKAVINLNVHTEGKLLLIHCENYFNGTLQFADGLPLSTKGEDAYHGFGVKSIRYIVEKYGGTLCIEQKGDTFAVNILFPEQQPN